HQGIVTVKDGSAISHLPEKILAVAHASGGIFHSNHVAALVQHAESRFYAEHDTGTAGDVVHHDGDINSSGNQLDVPQHPFLRGLVVIRHHNHQHIGAGFDCSLAEFNRIPGIVVGGARYDGNAAFGRLCSNAH